MNDPSITERVLDAVRRERKRQDGKFGAGRRLPNMAWLAILTEEVGEAAQAVIQAEADAGDPDFRLPAVLAEVIQCAAVSIAWAEFLTGLSEDEYSDALSGAIPSGWLDAPKGENAP